MSVQDDKSARLLEIEKSVEAQVTKPMKKVFAELLTLLESVWPGDEASRNEKLKALSKIDLKKFDRSAQGAAEKLLDGAERALSEGFASGLVEATSVGVPPASVFRTGISNPIVTESRAVAGKVAERVKLGRKALSQATTLHDAQAAVSVAATSINVVGQTARFVTNKAANEGLKYVADLDPDLISVWHPERDACVRCLNRAGQIDPKRLPPEHPNCRCVMWVLERETGKVIAASLVREAQRSILRGFSLPSESNRVRIDAARKLLNQGTNLPKSVKDYARTAVKRGQFPRGRQFPGVR